MLARHTGKPSGNFVKIVQIPERFITSGGLGSVFPVTVLDPDKHHQRADVVPVAARRRACAR